MVERIFPLQGLNGQLLIREDGVRAELLAEAEDTGAGLYKGYAAGPGGRLLLGTFVPEEGRLRLRRSVSRRELEQAGCWPVEGGEAVLAFSFSGGGEGAPEGWERAMEPERLLADRILRRSAAQVSGLLLRREKAGFWLAAPYGERSPFPMAPLFCLGRPGRIGGRRYILYRFDDAGVPQYPHEIPGNGGH